MFATSGYFKGVDCPFFKSGLCERPYCHLRHVKKDDSRDASSAISSNYVGGSRPSSPLDSALGQCSGPTGSKPIGSGSYLTKTGPTGSATTLNIPATISKYEEEYSVDDDEPSDGPSYEPTPKYDVTGGKPKRKVSTECQYKPGGPPVELEEYEVCAGKNKRKPSVDCIYQPGGPAVEVPEYEVCAGKNKRKPSTECTYQPGGPAVAVPEYDVYAGKSKRKPSVDCLYQPGGPAVEVPAYEPNPVAGVSPVKGAEYKPGSVAKSGQVSYVPGCGKASKAQTKKRRANAPAVPDVIPEYVPSSLAQYNPTPINKLKKLKKTSDTDLEYDPVNNFACGANSTAEDVGEVVYVPTKRPKMEDEEGDIDMCMDLAEFGDSDDARFSSDENLDESELIMDSGRYESPLEEDSADEEVSGIFSVKPFFTDSSANKSSDSKKKMDICENELNHLIRKPASKKEENEVSSESKTKKVDDKPKCEKVKDLSDKSLKSSKSSSQNSSHKSSSKDSNNKRSDSSKRRDSSSDRNNKTKSHEHGKTKNSSSDKKSESSHNHAKSKNSEKDRSKHKESDKTKDSSNSRTSSSERKHKAESHKSHSSSHSRSSSKESSHRKDHHKDSKENVKDNENKKKESHSKSSSTNSKKDGHKSHSSRSSSSHTNSSKNGSKSEKENKRHESSKSSSKSSKDSSNKREKEKDLANINSDLFGSESEEEEKIVKKEKQEMTDAELALFLEDSDFESDNDTFEECLKIFNEDAPSFKKSNSERKLHKDEHQSKNNEAQTMPGKKRVAHANDTRPTKAAVKKGPVKMSPAQVMHNRLLQMQQKALEAAEKRKAVAEEAARERSSGSQGTSSGNLSKRMAHLPKPKINAGPNLNDRDQHKRTVAITAQRGQKRTAHAPTISNAKRPTIPAEFGGKVPTNIRQRYLNLIIDECLKICKTEDEAYKKGQEEETAVYKRATNKNIYLRVAVNAIKRLRVEVEQSRPSPTKTSPSKVVKQSHEAMLGGKNATKTTYTLHRSGSANKSQTEDFKGAELYKRLSKYIMTEEQLKENGYPRPSPEGGSKAVFFKDRNEKDVILKAHEKNCVRCGKRFIVFPNGSYNREEECIYHWGKAWKKRVDRALVTSYNCCGGDLEAEGCQVCKFHVYESNKAENVTGYMKTIPSSPPIDGDYGVYAMDCEMVYTKGGMELARVTVIDQDTKPVYEALVKPEFKVIDYNTRFSGLTEADLKGVTTSLRDVQAVLLSLFTDKTILMGHSLESDLISVKLIHNTVVDTSIVFPHRLGLPYKRALRNLMVDFLKKIIQDDVGGHDSQEDAVACMQLMQWKLKEDAKKEIRLI